MFYIYICIYIYLLCNISNIPLMERKPITFPKDMRFAHKFVLYFFFNIPPFFKYHIIIIKFLYTNSLYVCVILNSIFYILVDALFIDLEYELVIPWVMRGVVFILRICERSPIIGWILFERERDTRTYFYIIHTYRAWCAPKNLYGSYVDFILYVNAYT